MKEFYKVQSTRSKKDVIRTETIVSILGEVSAVYRASKMAEERQGPTILHIRSVQSGGVTVRWETVGRIFKKTCYAQW